MRIDIYTKSWCGCCIRAKSLLDENGLTYRDIDIGADPGKEREMIERSGARTVPQILVDERHIGGCDDLRRFFHQRSESS